MIILLLIFIILGWVLVAFRKLQHFFKDSQLEKNMVWKDHNLSLYDFKFSILS